MILIDSNQVIIASCIGILGPDLKKKSDSNIGLIKHLFFSILLSYKKLYGKEYGDIVITCDSRKYWRKEYFPSYKGQRKHARDESTVDWDSVWKAIEEIRSDVKEYFPYKLINVDGAEADDVIAVLCKYSQENELIREGLFDDTPQKMLVLSSDTDFYQLQKYPNVRQWSPMMKKFVKPKTTAMKYLNEHIAGGDTGDNFPNVLTSDQWSKDRAENEESKQRQTPMMKARLEEFIAKGETACLTQEEKRNWHRNQTLVDFDYIPQDIQDRIIAEYKSAEVVRNKTKLMTYFTKNRMSKLFESISLF